LATGTEMKSSFDKIKAQIEPKLASHKIIESVWQRNASGHLLGWYRIGDGLSHNYCYLVSIFPGNIAIVGDMYDHLFTRSFEQFKDSPPDMYYLGTCLPNSLKYPKETGDAPLCFGYFALHKFLSLVNADGSPK